MRVSSVILFDDGLKARVVLQPSWFERLFGNRPSVVYLEKKLNTLSHTMIWYSAVTERKLLDLRWGYLMREALEMQPVETAAELPTARTVRT